MNDTESDRRLQEMLDREAIRDLVNRYFVAVWRQDADGVADLFADDGEFCFAGIAVGEDGRPTATADDETQTFKGRSVLNQVYKLALAEMRPLPFGHNHVVDLLGPDRACGHLVMEMRGAKDFELMGIVTYEDQYAKIDGRWLFARRFGRVRQPVRSSEEAK
ncbi:MAG TPA: nuclear transport factor 2 family protein [Alphaproteobacteria bacterium]|nr:nuclear transport factor 2 family protein [Alphaproteobacteria bacterium]